MSEKNKIDEMLKEANRPQDPLLVMLMMAIEQMSEDETQKIYEQYFEPLIPVFREISRILTELGSPPDDE